MKPPLLDLQWLDCAFDELTVHHLYTLLKLRQEVFVVEQTCPYLDADGTDQDARHCLGFLGEQLILYTRYFISPSDDTGVIGRVITHRDFRNRGLGHLLMLKSERCLLEQQRVSKIHLSAQAHLRTFYEKLGYRVCGSEYDEDGIPHLPMLKFIPPVE